MRFKQIGLILLTGVLILVMASSLLYAQKKKSSAKPPVQAELPNNVAKELLKAMGGEGFTRQMTQSILQSLKPRIPNASATFWNDFEKTIPPDEFMDLITPIYAKHFTVAEMKKMIAFYKTPEGKKLGKEFPAIIQEATPLGQGWGLQLGLRAMDQLKAIEGQRQ